MVQQQTLKLIMSDVVLNGYHVTVSVTSNTTMQDLVDALATHMINDLERLGLKNLADTVIKHRETYGIHDWTIPRILEKAPRQIYVCSGCNVVHQ